MKYKMSDAVETAVGAFSSVLFFVGVRSGEGPFFDYRIGLAITVVWLYLLYGSFVKLNNTPHSFFFVDALIAGGVSGVMVVLFSLASASSVWSINFFGGPAIVAFWLGFPVALLFDKFNIKSVLSRYYFDKRR